jgi:hypothetical protein
MEKYADKFSGRIITNFDEQRPVLADAPLSYQRLVAKAYERDTLEHFAGQIIVEKVDTLIEKRVTNVLGGRYVGNEIHVGRDAIINIDSVLTNSTQTIGSSSALDLQQKEKLESLVQSMKAELDTLKDSHPEDANEIAEAVRKVVATVSKSPEERKKRFLDLSAMNLLQAAQLVDKAAPTVMHISTQIAQFVQGLIAS